MSDHTWNVTAWSGCRLVLVLVVLEQVRRFWQAEEAVVVIDRAIFAAFSRELGHEPSEAVFSDLFPPVTNFRVACPKIAETAHLRR